MLKARLLDTCSYFTRVLVCAKDGSICISDLIALKVRRTKPHFSVSSNVLAENKSDFHIILAFQCASEFCYRQAKEYDNESVKW